jgi:hypothetical protein
MRGDNPSELGHVYFGTLGRAPPRGFNMGAVPYRQGRSEYIATPGGDRKLRTWSPVTSSWTLSTLGKSFYSSSREETVVHVPITVHGVRSGNQAGQSYTYTGWMPVDSEEFTRAYRQNGDMQALKNLVLASYEGNRMYNGNRVLSEYSQEIWTYRPGGQWRVSVLRSTPNGPGEAPDVSAVLQRPLGALVHTRLDKNLVIPEALIQVDDKMCTIRQMSVVLSVEQEKLIEEFNSIQPYWQDQGITAESILAYAVKHNITTTVLYNDDILAKHKPPHRAHTRAMTFHIEGHHCLFYRNPRVMLRRKPAKSQLRREPKEQPVEYVPYEGCLADGGLLQEGTFFYKDLDSLRLELLNSGECPQLSCSAPHCLKSLKVGKCIIKKDPDNSEELRAWLEKLNVPWCGDNLPSASLRALLSLLRPKRRHLTDAQKEALKAEQGNKCAECGCELVKTEYHHKTPLQHCGVKQEFVALCPECHQNFTFNQDGLKTENILMSSFERSVYEAYVESPKPRACIYEPNAHGEGRGDPLLLDIVRCRRNALFENPFDFPVFSPLDQFEVAQPGTLYDISYIKKDVKWTPSQLIQQLPFQGSGYYSAIATQWLLHTGKIGWSHITHGINATGRLPGNALQSALTKMEESWPDTDLGRDLRKRSINSLIGILCIDEASIWTVKSVLNEGEVRYMDYSVRTTNEFGTHGDTVTDCYYETRLDNAYRSTRPIHDHCLHTELTRLAMAVDYIRKLGVPRQDICTFKTDSVGFYARQKRKSKCMELQELTFASLKRPKLLTQSEVSSTESTSKVFRVTEEKKPLLTHPTLPIIDADPPILENWAWRDHPAEAALELVDSGQSFCLRGEAGTGKTYMTRQIVSHLQEKGERVQCIGKTHVACSLLHSESTPSMTVQRFVYKHILAGSYKGWVILDECSLCELRLWTYLYRLLNTCKFICVGSWSQLPPVGGHQWLDTQLPDDCVETSRMFHRLCGGNRITLTECKRSDDVLFNWVTSLCPGGSRFHTPFPEVLAEAREFFKGSETPQWTLCIDHEMRKRINKEQNLREKPPDAIFVKVPRVNSACAPQDFFLYVGQTLICHTQNSKGNIKNGLFYTVSEIKSMKHPQNEDVSNQDDDQAANFVKVLNQENLFVSFECGLTLPLRVVAKSFRLSHCLTVSSSQGRTCENVLRIITKHRRFGRKHLMVSLSRAREAKSVQVV